MKVSVIIPCYNRAALVGETIRCVLQQTLPPDEIIVVDDGSTDNTLEVLKSFGPRVQILQQQNAGPGAARNAGLAVAGGDYVWFMDSDDLASLNKLEVQTRALEQSGADIALSPWIKCHLEGSRALAETHVLQQKGLPRSMAQDLVGRWTVVLQTCLFRRSLLKQAGGFDPTYMVAEDQLLFLKCLLAGARVIHTPNCLIVYRTSGNNKLTEKGCVPERRFLDWSRFLLESRQLCLLAGPDPLHLFAFRLRLWNAWRDMTMLKSKQASEMCEEITTCLGGSLHSPIYTITQKCQQWLGGMRQRLFGDRSPFALRAGSIRPEQIYLISDLGYALHNRKQ